jgi:hypothetical protein
MQLVKLPREWFAMEPRERIYMWTLCEDGALDAAATALCRRVDEACQQALGDHLWAWVKTGRDVPTTQIVWTAA